MEDKDKKISELTAENAALTSENEDLKLAIDKASKEKSDSKSEKKISDLTKENANLSATNDELKSSLDKASIDNESLKGENELLTKENEVLKKFLAESNSSLKQDVKPGTEKPTLPKEAVFVVDKKKYELLVPQMNVPGIGILTAAEILHHPKAQRALVEADSGLIKKLL